MFAIKCPECGSYYVVKAGDGPVRFKCKICRNKFSLSVPLPNHEGQSKRIPAYIKARIMADSILGMDTRRLMDEYGIGRNTLFRIKRYFKENRLIYVWRINYDDRDFFLKELERGILRQGWGAEGMDLRKGPEAFVRAWKERRWLKEENERKEKAVVWRFNVLKVMLVIKPGDYVIVPKLPHDHAFTLVEVKNGYDFAVAEGKGDYGHRIGVKKLGEFSSAFADLEEVREFYNPDVQWVNEMLRSVRWFYPAVAVVGREFRKMYEVVGRLAERSEV